MELFMKSIKYLLFIILFSVFVGRAQDKPKTIEDSVVARLDKNYLVTLNDLQQHIADWRYERRFRDKSAMYRNALKEMITDRLRVFDFFDRKLNEKRTNFPYTSNKKSNTHIGLIMQFTKREKKIATNFTD